MARRAARRPGLSEAARSSELQRYPGEKAPVLPGEGVQFVPRSPAPAIPARFSLERRLAETDPMAAELLVPGHPIRGQVLIRTAKQGPITLALFEMAHPNEWRSPSTMRDAHRFKARLLGIEISGSGWGTITALIAFVVVVEAAKWLLSCL
jgi:hypothetical protein